MAEWPRLVATTISDYAKGVEVELAANQMLMAALKKKGNISYNQTGLDFNWQVEYREVPLNVTTGEDTISPARQDAYKRATLDMAGYQIADVFTKRERLKNGGGPTQIINYYKLMSDRLFRNLKRQFGEEFYIDSSASGNSGRLSGIETMMALNGTTNITSGAQRSATAADVVGYPNDTYAGLSTALAGGGGTWTSQADINTTWPAGRGTLNYDYWSPVVVNTTSTSFDGATDTWKDQCVQVTRYAVTHMQRYDDNRRSMKMLLLDRDMYRQYLDKLDAKEHIYVTSENSLKALGFDAGIQQDGCEITWEFGVPGAVGYGFNIDNMELRSYQDELIKTQGPIYEPKNQSWYTIVDCFAQLKFRSPKFFCKLAALA